MLAIVPIIILAGGLSTGAFDETFVQDTASTEKTTIVLSAADIQDNKDRDLYFD